MYKLPASLDAPLPRLDNGITLADCLPGEEAAEDAELETTSGQLRVDLDNVLCTLSPREAGVLRARYGLDDGRPRTLEDIGHAFQARARLCSGLPAAAVARLWAAVARFGAPEAWRACSSLQGAPESSTLLPPRPSLQELGSGPNLADTCSG